MNHPFTETFITMARAAEEIQALAQPFGRGDWFVLDSPLFGEYYGGAIQVQETEKRDHEVFAAGVYCVGDETTGGPAHVEWTWDLPRKDQAAWLPRLDQLLGMLGTPEDFLEKAACADNCRGAMFTVAQAHCSDWHELTLVVVMREKYGKTWDGKGWVKV